MITPNPSPAAPPTSQARSQLATGAYPGARRLSLPLAGHTFPGFRTSNRATTRALRGRDQLGAAQAEGTKSAQALEAVADAEPVNPGSAPDAHSILIAGGKPNPAGNTAAPRRLLPVSAQHPFRSLKRQTLNQTGSQCSERNKTIPVRVGNDADLRAGRAHLSRKRPVLRLFRPRLVGLARVGRHPSFLSPVVAVTAGVSQPQSVRSGDSIVGISHRALGKTSREIGGHEHVCVR